MRDAEGRLIPDVRAAVTAKLDWVIDPFIEAGAEREAALVESPLRTTFRAFQALTQRGKGGVYKALDLSVRPPRFCILKEGRACGELTWDKRDGRWRVQHEENVLVALCAAGIAVPRVYSSFEVEDNYYLVTELIDGETLQSLLCRRRRRLDISRALLYGVRLASLIARIHAAGWAWRDCKPTNIVVVSSGELRPLDFEGACPIEQPDPTPWGTMAFTPPRPFGGHAARSSTHDLYALGVIIYLLLSGRLPERAAPVALVKLRRNVPARAHKIITELLSADPLRQPNAMTVVEELMAALSDLDELSPVRLLCAGRKCNPKMGRSAARG
jgi:serine/threonine protein kinase